MAERKTFSTIGAMRLFTDRRMVIACPARCPRIRSTTRRAFCGEVRMYLASALASISLTSLSLCRRFFGGGLGGVPFIGPRGRKLAQFVAHHVFRDVDGDELPTVMHAQRMADERRLNGRSPRPGAHHFLFVLVVHGDHLLDQ